MTALRWRFRPVDTWFFREARPHDAVGVGQLDSVFPPPITTLMGAIRTTLGDQAGVDWHRFRRGEAGEAHEWLGDASDTGALRVREWSLRLDGERLYPAPADLLVETQTDGERRLHRLTIGDPVHCDLGYVALPEMPETAPPGCKPVENAWLTETGIQQWAAGVVPAVATLIEQRDLVTAEPRLGIGRNNARGTVEEGLLYQTRHLRLRHDRDIAVDVVVDGAPEALRESLPQHTSVRLGGEGREAGVEIEAAADPASGAAAGLSGASARGVIVMMRTPGVFAQQGRTHWLLPDFQVESDDQGWARAWRGEIREQPLRLVSACMGRMLRRGGWDQKAHRPRTVTASVAPGSLFFLEPTSPDQTPQALIDTLAEGQIGGDAAWGQGQYMTGLWF